MESTSYHLSKSALDAPLDPARIETSDSPRPDAGKLRLYRFVRTALGIIFVCSGIFKLIDPKGFGAIIEAYGLIPEATILPVAIGLSVLEVLAGLGLVLDVQWSLGTITVLLIFFMGILAYGLMLGLDVDCGCFGPDDPEAAAYHSLRPALYRDIVMLAGIGYLYFRRWRQSIHPIRLSAVYQLCIHTGRRKHQ